MVRAADRCTFHSSTFCSKCSIRRFSIAKNPRRQSLSFLPSLNLSLVPLPSVYRSTHHVVGFPFPSSPSLSWARFLGVQNSRGRRLIRPSTPSFSLSNHIAQRLQRYTLGEGLLFLLQFSLRADCIRASADRGSTPWSHLWISLWPRE